MVVQSDSPRTSLPDTQQSVRSSIGRFMAVGFAALLGVIASTGVLMMMNQRQGGWLLHTFEVQREIADIRLSVTQLIGVQRNDRRLPSGQSDHTAAELRANLARTVAQLAMMTRDNPRQQARMPLLMATIAGVEQRTGLTVPVAARVRVLSDDPGERVAALCAAMLEEESRLMEYRKHRGADLANAVFVILGFTAILLLVMVWLTYTTISSYTRQVADSRTALHDANSGLETAVEERTAELIRANAEIQRFVYIVSHDLRSPLINIMGFTAEIASAVRRLQDQLDKALAGRPETVDPQTTTIIAEDIPEAINFIRASAEKMDRLINAILHLSRMGRRTLRPEWFNLTELINAVIDTMQSLVKDAAASITVDNALARSDGSDAGPQLHSDRIAVDQILSNLIENAIKYHYAGRALHITVSVARHGDHVAIAVADNGRGIAERDKERVFDLFRRSGAQDQPGEGIGLAHVRALAYRLGGTIRLDSTFGTGSTFTLTLPLHFHEVSGAPA